MLADEGQAPARPRGPFSKELAALGDLVRLIVPIVAGNFANVMADRWTLAFVGHWDFKDRSHYDGMGIGKMYSNITGLSLGIGANIGLATFCSQAHGSGRSSQMNAVFVRRALVLLSFTFVLSLSAALLCEDLLLLFDQPPEVARTSARFAQVQVFGVPFYWLSNAANIALNGTKHTRPGFIMSLVSAGAQLVLSALFASPKVLNLGYLGVALARSLGGVVSVLTIAVCTKCQGLEQYVWKLHPDAEPVLRPGAIKEYLKVSVPSALVVWSEWWAFEVLAILVGRTPDAVLNLAAHGTMFNIIVVFYMAWTGTCTAVCTLVGNLLGAGRNTEIRPLLRAAFAFSLGTGVLVAVGYEAGKGLLADAFTEDLGVRALMRSSSLGLVLSVPLYALLMTFYGALRGANFQRPGILGTFVGYWVVGIPLAAVLGCVWHWPSPLLGVWMGNVVALAIAASWVCWSVFVRIDWLTVRRVDNREAPLLNDRRNSDQEMMQAQSEKQSPAVEADDPVRGA